MLEFETIFKKYPYCFGYLDVNCKFTPKLTDWCKENNIKKYLLHLADEDDPTRSGDPYSASSTDTISFKRKEDAALFKLTWC